MEKNIIKKNVIILNHMFTGNYLQDNIGHEIINLFSDDNGDQYIYLCKDGVFNRADINVEYIVQVRRPDKTTRTLEIINVASDIQVCGNNEDKKPIPVYGGKSIYNIFKHNNKQQEVCATFKAGTMLKSDDPLYIWYGNQSAAPGLNGTVLTNYNPSQQLREYIYEGDPNYDNLMKLIEEECASTTLPRVDLNCDTSASPAEIYGVEGRELSYSDAFKYFIKGFPEFFIQFCNCLKGKNEQVIQVYREWRNIDLLVECNKHIFVVENKIFSDLNGKNGDQLSKYEKIIEEEIKKTESRFYQKNPIYILLLPDHNNIPLKPGGKWRTIRYSDIYNYLKNLSKSQKDNELEDLIKSLEPHTHKDYNRSVMLKRFVRAIQKTESSH